MNSPCRDELAKQLHDGIGGTLATITTLAHYGTTLDDPGKASDAFGQIARLSSNALKELRSFLDSFQQSTL